MDDGRIGRDEVGWCEVAREYPAIPTTRALAKAFRTRAAERQPRGLARYGARRF